MNSSLCYIENDNKFLMLYRNKKENDINEGKWIGVGGKFEVGESPEECMIREIKEEAGISVKDYKLRGLITFVCDDYPTEYMHLFWAKSDEKDVIECDEGELKWIDKDKVLDLNIWEGDKISGPLPRREGKCC